MTSFCFTKTLHNNLLSGLSSNSTKVLWCNFKSNFIPNFISTINCQGVFQTNFKTVILYFINDCLNSHYLEVTSSFIEVNFNVLCLIIIFLVCSYQSGLDCINNNILFNALGLFQGSKRF